MLSFINPNWTAPPSIRAFTTTREGGISPAPFDSLNLGETSGENLENINRNRILLKKIAKLPRDPLWLKQLHSNQVIDAASPSTLEADGSYTDQPNVICALQTADCLPLLLCNSKGTEVAALHCGWKGLSQNIIQKGLEKFKESSQNLLAWMGPAIGPCHFEIDDEVRERFIAQFSTLKLDQKNNLVFSISRSHHWWMNLYEFTRQQLQSHGIKKIFNYSGCTYCEVDRFYSYRRQPITGRMATLIWINPL